MDHHVFQMSCRIMYLNAYCLMPVYEITGSFSPPDILGWAVLMPSLWDYRFPSTGHFTNVLERSVQRLIPIVHAKEVNSQHAIKKQPTNQEEFEERPFKHGMEIQTTVCCSFAL